MPPTLAATTIKEIGEKVCKIAPEKLSDENLTDKCCSKKAIGEDKSPIKAVLSRKEAKKGKKKKLNDHADEASKKTKMRWEDHSHNLPQALWPNFCTYPCEVSREIYFCFSL